MQTDCRRWRSTYLAKSRDDRSALCFASSAASYGVVWQHSRRDIDFRVIYRAGFSVAGSLISNG